MKLIFSFDTSSLISFNQERGQLEIEVDNPVYSPPYLSTWKEGNVLFAQPYHEVKGYHIHVGRNGTLKLVPYGANR